MSAVPPAAFAAALACLPGIGPATLCRLLADADPEDAWRMVLEGLVVRPVRPKEPLAAAAQPPLTGAPAPAGRRSWRAAGVSGHPSWSLAAARLDPAELWRRCRQGRIDVTWRGQPDYPATLRDDPEPPGVLFWRGRLDWLERRCVAVVGTRRCTPDGRVTAYEMGRDLASAGVCVVSGLALGIDGAAHAGALAGGRTAPVAVAASGVDRPYPRQNAALWERVATAGAVLSEAPVGAPAQAWRFPARNRIIAALVELVVIVESHVAGGSLLTAEAALSRGVELRAVPGPVRSPASQGSNQLLYDGGGPVRHAEDVLDTLGLVGRPAAARGARPGARQSERRFTDRRSLGQRHRRVLEAVSVRPTSLGQVVERSGFDVATVATLLSDLEAAGGVGCEGSWWVRRA